jgi:hypothetical protein
MKSRRSVKAMSANAQSAQRARVRETSGSVADLAASSAARFSVDFKKLVHDRDAAVGEFILAFEARKRIPSLEEADPERGLENSIVKAVSGYPAGRDVPLHAGVCTNTEIEWRAWTKRLCDATGRVVNESPYYFRVIDRIAAENHLSRESVIRRLLIGYALSPTCGLASEPW